MRWPSCVLLLCTACSAVNECPAVAPAALNALPQKLSETGLATARPYTPRFELWSDGAKKRRWISLPANARIDTSDMDAWQFPVGTRLWKEFAFDAIVAETRMMERTEQGWTFVAYAWNGDASEATQLPLGGAATTVPAHDIPAADQCFGCHGGTPSGVLGFSAIQLGNDAQTLFDEGLLTDAPPSLELPGDEDQRAGLGYLHANCSHCHNQHRPVAGAQRCYDPNNGYDFQLRVGALADLESTNAVRTLRKNPSRGEEMIERVKRTSAQGGMPPLAKSAIDHHGVETIQAFIDSL